MPRTPALTEYLPLFFRETLDSQSPRVRHVVVRSVKAEATKTITRIEEIPPAVMPIWKPSVCATRRVTLAAATTAILLVCSSVEGSVKAEETNSAGPTETFKISMKVSGKPAKLNWILRLPKRYMAKAVYARNTEKDGTANSLPDDRGRLSSLFINKVDWKYVAPKLNLNSDNSSSYNERYVYIIISTYNFGSSFSEMISEKIKGRCLAEPVNDLGLISLKNIPEKTQFDQRTKLPLDAGSCGVRTDGKSRKFLRTNSSGEYDLELTCQSSVRPNTCEALARYHGWPVRYNFPKEHLHQHVEIQKNIYKFLKKNTISFDDSAIHGD